MAKGNYKEKVNELLKQLEEGVQEVFLSDKFSDWLNFLSKFHDYSFNNTLLIMFQCPHASKVAGYKTWQELGRQVKKGSKAIRILAPMIIKKEDEKTGEERSQIVGFRYVNVFDISQTEGEEVPTLVENVKTESEQAKEALETLKDWTEGQADNVRVIFQEDTGSSNGYYRYKDKNDLQIVVNSNLPLDHKCKTLIHEVAHYLTIDLDNMQDRSRSQYEVIAESVAYIVSNYLGFDTSEYSFGYVAGWSMDKDLETLKSVAETITKTSQQLIGVLNVT